MSALALKGSALIDYTAMAEGKRVRLPRGQVRQCPQCKRRGLRLVFSHRRGRYEIAYWHTSAQDVKGFAPLLLDGCTIRARSLSELPPGERSPR